MQRVDATRKAVQHWRLAEHVLGQMRRYGPSGPRVKAWGFHVRRAIEWCQYGGATYGG